MANLKYQLKRQLEKMKSYGQSKHRDKKDIQSLSSLTGKSISTVKAPGIYNRDNTYRSYMDINQKFGAWMQINHPDVKKLTQIKKCHAEEYLLQLKDKGLRAGTLQTYAAGIVKSMGWNCKDINKQLPTKRSQTPIKGRSGTSKHFSEKKHKDLIEFESNTGIRPSEARQITADQIKVDSKGNVFLDFKSCRAWQVMTKGGRGRFVKKIRQSYQKVLLKIKETCENNKQKRIWEKYSDSTFHNGNLHQYRRVFAQNTYNDICAEIEEREGYSAVLDYHSRKYDEYYNREALKAVSEELGHSRIDVVVSNYFR